MVGRFSLLGPGRNLGNRICSPQPAPRSDPHFFVGRGLVAFFGNCHSFTDEVHHYDHDRSDPGGINAHVDVDLDVDNDQASVELGGHGIVDTRSRPFVSSRSREDAAPTYVAKPIARSRPVHISIPIIGVSVPLSVLNLNKDGKVNVPTNYSVPGWYNGDQSPGQKGSAVILGHVDNFHGPAVFYHLDKLKLGNRVDVTLKDGRKLMFAVIVVRMFQKTNFPDKLVYGARDYPALQLVTCGGIFDPKTGHYLSNIVVFTALIKS